MMHHKTTSLVLFAFLAFSAPLHAADAPQFGAWGFDAAGQNKQVKPGDDFFQYANGVYVEHLEIPADRTRFGAFDTLAKLSEERVHAILEEAGDTKIGRYYRAYLDEAEIEKRGTRPLEADLTRLRAAKTRDDIAAVMGDRSVPARALFYAGIGADEKNPDQYVVGISTGGYGLPDRDYYLKSSFAEIRDKYRVYIEQMLTLAGWPDAKSRADDILKLETRFAEASWERFAFRDRDKTYNPVTASELAALSAGFNFRRYLAAGNLGQVDHFIVADNTAFPKKAAIFAETPVETLKAWLAFNIVDASAPVLPQRFVDARFAFRNKTLSGQPEIAPRWKRAVGATNGALGEEVGREYVARHFPPEAKQRMLELVANMRLALKARIENLTWMTPETKTRALEKLALFKVKIAYPDVWRDYSALAVESGDAYGNLKRSRVFEWNRDVTRLGKAVDRTEWWMTPQTVNAYYDSTFNDVVFPAAILQPPFFDPKADDAANYGGIGGVIGHEMSHGFDDQGRKSDGHGRLTDWWTADDASKFDAQAERLGAQYGKYEILPGEFINGKLTTGENIGDLGGLNTALTAYRASLGGKPSPVIDGTTGEQRVFLGWAQVWRGKSRDETARRDLYTDPHAPFEARVNGVVRNIDAWYDAFGVKPGDKLYLPPDQRVRIW